MNGYVIQIIKTGRTRKTLVAKNLKKVSGVKKTDPLDLSGHPNGVHLVCMQRTGSVHLVVHNADA